MNVLVVTTLSDNVNFGGDVCSMRNIESIRSIGGVENIIVYSLYDNKNRSKLNLTTKIFSIFKGYMLNVDDSKLSDIISILKNEKIDIVFLDSSLLGVVAKRIKVLFPQILIISFFHNVEIKFLYQCILIEKRITRLYWILLAYLNEIYSLKYSDKTIALNSRDKDLIYKIYRRKVTNIIPISLKADLYSKENNSTEINENVNNIGSFVCLFVGSYFYANIEGIKWFLKNVLPKVDITLYVVGKDMDKLLINKELLGKVKVFSNVPCLSKYYNMANCVIMPIFSGSGMKVKTAEALKYGKVIVGSDEALEGYDLANDSFYRCNSADEFANAINILKSSNTPRFCEESFECFKNNYSFDSTLKLFKELFV